MKLLPLLIALMASGCVNQPQAVDGQVLRQLASLGNSPVFSATSNGHLVAYAGNGLELLDVRSDGKFQLSSEAPSRLAWSPDNTTLAATFPVADYETDLVQYSADGKALYKKVLPVAVSSLYWSLRGDLLVTGYRLNVYSFGGNLQQYLYRFDGNGVEEVVLTDTTLRPRTVMAVSNALSQVLPVLFTPYGDELFYVHFHDPPEFNPYLAIVSKNWQVENEKELLKLSLQTIEIEKGVHDDAAVVLTGTKTINVESWPEVRMDTPPEARYHFLGGKLFSDQSLVADWGQGTAVQLLSNGHFMLAYANNLFLGSGLHEQQERVYKEKFWLLRRWRASGLITHADYSQQISKDR